ncbi:glycosyltransferase family 4 protein [Leptospira idonii]|uniref:Glycosyltransferase family 1 protein n=1 Tax=Leptospira idonii TaxID=1193500 RepID=A0A4R9LZF9_9LEPT|nr:glycosyltransferase family 1 protein [Leptospira idonii]TGN19750.1 glycosyltransferase family 1 protein [Leptospira idonii]
MKLGIDVRPLAYGITGNSRYLAEVLRIIIPKSKGNRFYFFSNKPIHPVFKDLLEFESVVPVIESKPWPGPLYLNWILPKRLKALSIDTFWGTLQMLPFRKLDIPSFVNYHDLNFVSAPETMAKWNYYQHKFLSPRTIKNADRIFCLSKNTKNEISAFDPKATDKCLVVYPGVIRRKFKKEKNFFPKPFFLTIGTLEPRKNIKLLTEAFSDFKQQNPKDKHSLVILGRKGWGEEGDKLYAELTRPEAKDKGIYFFENPNDDLLGQGIEECEVFFFPSHHEGFGLPLLEAMIEDKRCVASQIPVFEEILSPCDRYVPSSSRKGWADAFAEAAKFKTKTRKPPFPEKEWSWVRTAKQIEEVIFP